MRDKLNVLGVGELLWDIFPNRKMLGGAPYNFVYHAKKLGAKVSLLSAIGNDNNGREIMEILKTNGIRQDLIQLNNKPTGSVSVILDKKGIPSYNIQERVAWDFIRYNPFVERKVTEADIICFGTLAQRSDTSEQVIQRILKNCRPDALLVYDINLRQHFYNQKTEERSLQFCNILKLNDEELELVCELVKIKADDEQGQLVGLLNNYNIRLIALTKGSSGSLLITKTDQSSLQSPLVDVKDTVGAGDSFTAALAIGLARDKTLIEVHKKTIKLSALVCTKSGATPQYNLKKIKF